jgi:uncharacterized membrane protein
VRPSLVALAAIAWFVFLLIAPVSAAPIAAAAYALGSLVCHQFPTRSFHYGAVQLPVCARCIGIYGGAAIGAVVFAARADRLGAASPRAVLLASCVPVIVTVALEWAGAWAPGNVIRALTGVVLGVAAAFVVVGAATTINYDECARRRPNVPSPPPASI